MGAFEEMKMRFVVPRYVRWSLKRRPQYAFVTREALDYHTAEAVMDEAEAGLLAQFPRAKHDGQRSYYRHQVRFFFTNPRMAVAFKIRWC